MVVMEEESSKEGTKFDYRYAAAFTTAATENATTTTITPYFGGRIYTPQVSKPRGGNGC
jgi:hypothetical protein